MQVHDFLDDMSIKTPDNVAVWYNEKELSYKQLAELSNSIGNWLKSQITKGDRVSMLIDNSFYHLAIYFGILKAGGVVVAMNPLLGKDVLKYQIDNSGSGVFITQLKHLRKIKDMLSTCNNLKTLMVDSEANILNGFDKEIVLYDDIINNYSNEEPAVGGIDLNLAEIVYTSGSTGQPKGVMLTHLNLVSNMNSIVDYLHLTKDDKVMVVLPFYYIYGKSLLLTHFLVGGSVVIDNRFMYPNKVLETMAETRVTGFAGVPSTFSVLLNKSNLKSFDLPSLRYVTQAGGAMAPAVQKEVVKAFSPALLYVMYGATEAAPRLSYLEPALLERKWGSIGKPVKNVEIIISDGEGHEMPKGEVGEISARGSNIMKGYWKDETGTSDVLRHGYYYTGDLGYKDEEGFIFIAGRSKDIIKVKGFRVSAKEIEEKILELKEIHETAVIAVKDELMGEVPLGFVVLKDDQEIDEDGIKKHLKSTIASYKIPQKIIFRENLPKNESGKIMKTQLEVD